MTFTVLMQTAALLASAMADAPPTTMQMNDGTVRGQRLMPYQHSWLQCSRQNGEWTELPALTEDLVRIGPLFRHTQTTRQADGQGNLMTSRAVTYLTAGALGPVRMEQVVTDAEGRTLMHAERTLDEDGYRGQARSGDKSRELSGPVGSLQWHGGALGLPLVTVASDQFPP